MNLLPAVLEFVVPQAMHIDSQRIGNLERRGAPEDPRNRRPLHEVASMQHDRGLGSAALALDQASDIRGPTATAVIRLQTGVEVVEMQERDPLYSPGRDRELRTQKEGK